MAMSIIKKTAAVFAALAIAMVAFEARYQAEGRERVARMRSRAGL